MPPTIPKTAVLGSRICLDPCMTDCWVIEFAMQVVNSYLRMIVKINTDTGVLETMGLPEPLVSEAVAHPLNPRQNKLWCNTIRTLVYVLFAPGLLNKGRSGKLTTRLLLILARDRLLADSLSPTLILALRNPLRSLTSLEVYSRTTFVPKYYILQHAQRRRINIL